MPTLSITTHKKREVLDITEEVSRGIAKKTVLVHVFVAHTTAAITTADLDPGTDLDLLDALADLLPDKQWRHPHDPAHAPDHLLASIVGPSVTVPCAQEKLLLGTWQRIILIEFDGPRSRTVNVTHIQVN
jgi:secondary thiamine-phosphate synthase enzyme